MAQPTKFVPSYDFSDFQAASPNDPLPGAQVDSQLALLKTTTDEIIDNIGLIQKDDGTLANASVGIDQLKTDVDIGFSSITDWLTATAYALRDGVFKDGALYRCIVAHTSGTFSTDLAAAKWVLIYDFTTAPGFTIGTDLQAWDTHLDDIAALTPTDGNVIVGDGANWVAESGATARASLGLTIGTNVQAWDADLDTIAALSSADSNFIVGSAAGWVVESGATARTSLGLGSIATQAASAVAITGGSVTGITDLAVADGGTGASSAAAARTNLGLVIGTDVQAYDATLLSIAALGTAANKLAYTTGIDTWAEADLTAAGRALLDDADAAAQRATLGFTSPILDRTAPGAIGGATPDAITVTTALVGATSAATLAGFEHQLQVAAAGPAGASVSRYQANAASPKFSLYKSRATTVGGTPAAVQLDDGLGDFLFAGDDGTNPVTGAAVFAAADGVVSTGVMPSRIMLSTVPNGSGTLTERLRISQDGAVSHRANNTIVISAESHLGLRSYTVGTLPSAATAGRIIHVSDETGGAQPAQCDGANWRRWADNAIVS